jgi:hypothetical protein
VPRILVQLALSRRRPAVFVSVVVAAVVEELRRHRLNRDAETLELVGLDESPNLKPEAARALLRLLVNVARARAERDEDDGGREAA